MATIKQNVFYWVSMEFTEVQKWLNTADFDHFVFQQSIESTEVGDFGLIAYARTAALLVMNGGKPVKTTPSNYKPFVGTKPNIQFANMKLFGKTLSGMYPPGSPDQPLMVYPAGNGDSSIPPYYKGTAYVQYVAWTAGGAEAGTPVPIDPSPPHNS